MNKVPRAEKEFSSMNEQEFNTWLKEKNENDDNSSEPVYTFMSVPEKQQTQESTKTLILPITLENNATVSGTASVLEEFGQQFKIPCVHTKVVLQYNESLGSFDIDAARKHYEFLYLLQEHKNEMEQLEMQLNSVDKELDASNRDELHVDADCDDEMEEVNASDNCTSFQKVDGKFKKIVDNITRKMWQAMQSSDPAAVVILQQYLKANSSTWESARDHHGCTIIHHAVQNGNHSLVQTLLNAGVNPNVKERCGATPLTLAILKGDEKMVKLLIDNFAICEDSYFSSVPGPKLIASKLGFENIVTMIDNSLVSENQTDLEIWKVTANGTNETLVIQEDTNIETDELGYYSRNLVNCKTLVVGDQGTNKIVRSVKDKSQLAYGWAAEVPGDMHARGRLYFS